MYMQSVDSAALKHSYDREGFVIVRGVFSRADILRLREHAEELIGHSTSAHIQRAYNDTGALKLVKASGLADSDTVFRTIATQDTLVDIVELLLGARARRFRDVMVVKPARTAGVFSYHQDSAYWDVEPKSLVSCWIGLGDVGTESSCLQVIPGTHRKEIEHALYMGRRRLPALVTKALRRLVSVSGTGDNPEGAGGAMWAWKAKRWLLANATRYAPFLFDLQDFRLPLVAVAQGTERLLAVEAGDVIFFHSLLWHASGPN